MRARGLKQSGSILVNPVQSSRPMRARGLKPNEDGSLIALPLVAPHAGAWIETVRVNRFGLVQPVAPHAGAWIETTKLSNQKIIAATSRPMRARGLKPTPMLVMTIGLPVAPHAGAWIETFRRLLQ